MAKLKLLFLEELAQVCKHYSFKRLKAKLISRAFKLFVNLEP
jgi:hypothetical protein